MEGYDFQLMSLSVSLLAVVVSFFGLFVSLKVARIQVASARRQKWNDELIASLVEYLSECESLVINGDDGLLNDPTADHLLVKRLLLLSTKIQLMLDPTDSVQAELLDLINLLLDDIQHGTSNLLEFGARVNGVKDLSRQVVAKEWKIVTG